MTENPSADGMIAPSPGGAVCWTIDLLLTVISFKYPLSLLVPFLVNPLLGLILSLLNFKDSVLAILPTLYSVYRLKKRKSECWPVWKGLYCCWRGERPWTYVLLRY